MLGRVAARVISLWQSTSTGGYLDRHDGDVHPSRMRGSPERLAYLLLAARRGCGVRVLRSGAGAPIGKVGAPRPNGRLQENRRRQEGFQEIGRRQEGLQEKRRLQETHRRQTG